MKQLTAQYLSIMHYVLKSHVMWSCHRKHLAFPHLIPFAYVCINNNEGMGNCSLPSWRLKYSPPRLLYCCSLVAVTNTCHCSQQQTYCLSFPMLRLHPGDCSPLCTAVDSCLKLIWLFIHSRHALALLFQQCEAGIILRQQAKA